MNAGLSSPLSDGQKNEHLSAAFIVRGSPYTWPHLRNDAWEMAPEKELHLLLRRGWFSAPVCQGVFLATHMGGRWIRQTLTMVKIKMPFWRSRGLQYIAMGKA